MGQFDSSTGTQIQEVRWGDSANVALEIPAASTAVAATPFIQLADIRVPHAAVWCAQIALEWLNFGDGIVPEQLMLDSFLRVGVGSVEWATFRQVTVFAGGFLPIEDTIISNIPATRMSLSGRVRVQLPVSAPARTYQVRFLLMAAPYGWLRGVDDRPPED